MIWIGIEFSDHQDTYDGSTHDLTMVMSVADQMLTGGFSNQSRTNMLAMLDVSTSN